VHESAPVLCYTDVSGRNPRPILCALRTRASALAPLKWMYLGAVQSIANALGPQTARRH